LTLISIKTILCPSTNKSHGKHMSKLVEVKADIEEVLINAIFPDLYHESVSRIWKRSDLEIKTYLHAAHVFGIHGIAEEITWLQAIFVIKGGE